MFTERTNFNSRDKNRLDSRGVQGINGYFYAYDVLASEEFEKSLKIKSNIEVLINQIESYNGTTPTKVPLVADFSTLTTSILAERDFIRLCKAIKGGANVICLKLRERGLSDTQKALILEALKENSAILACKIVADNGSETNFGQPYTIANQKRYENRLKKDIRTNEDFTYKQDIFTFDTQCQYFRNGLDKITIPVDKLNDSTKISTFIATESANYRLSDQSQPVRSWKKHNVNMSMLKDRDSERFFNYAMKASLSTIALLSAVAFVYYKPHVISDVIKNSITWVANCVLGKGGNNHLGKS